MIMLAVMSISNMVMSGLFVLLPLVGSILLVFGLWQVIMDVRAVERRKMMERLKDKTSSTVKKQRAVESLLRKQAREGALDMLLSRVSCVPKLQRLLNQADLDWSASRVLVNLGVATVLAVVGLYLLGYKTHYVVLLSAGVFFLPLLYVGRRRKRRLKKLLQQLPDVFELMSQALRAGHSLASGIGLVAEQLPDPAGTEFARVFHEQNLGVKVEDALLHMADRVDQLDVRFFVTAVLIQRQTGGDLAEVLDNITVMIRERIELFGKVQALTAEGRLSGWVLFALPIVVFIAEMVINPEYAEVLLYDPTGKVMTFVTVCMMITGMAMIKKIVDIKV